MDKALVVGGSNGMGLAITKNLNERGYFVEICDRVAPEDGAISDGFSSYHHCDLLDLDVDLIESLAEDKTIKMLVYQKHTNF